MFTKLRILASVSSAALIIGCSGVADNVAAPVVVTSGTYMLTTVNGVPAPTILAMDPTVLIRSGSITINTDGTFKSEVNYSRMVDGAWYPITDTCGGTYSRNSRGLVFYESETCNGSYGATVSGRTLSVLYQPSLSVAYSL